MLIAHRNGMLVSPPRYWGLCFTAEEPGVVVSMAKAGSPPAVTLETSRDGVTWKSFDADGGTTPITLAKTGDYVYFRAGPAGNARMSKSESSAYRCFRFSGRCAASGNVMSLLSATDPNIGFATANTYALARLFNGCASLTTAPELPATTLSDGCYYRMFYHCTELTTAPELPATTLADSCYYRMFRSCTKLTTAPELPATTLAGSCYYDMFGGCTSLTAAPELPATTLADSCYGYMFAGCASLTVAPVLPATTLVHRCYCAMFDSCTSLREVEVAFSAWATELGATTIWLSYVSATGTFRCPRALGTNTTITRDASHCHVGWTVVNTD